MAALHSMLMLYSSLKCTCLLADTAAESYSTSEDDAPSSLDSDLEAAEAELQTKSPAGSAQKAAANSNAAVASQRAGPTAAQSASSLQLSHQAARKQQAGSQSENEAPPDEADELTSSDEQQAGSQSESEPPPDEADELTSSSEQSEAVQPGHLSDQSHAGQLRPLNVNLPHLQDAAAVLPAQPVQGSNPLEHSQPAAAQQPPAASPAHSNEPSSAEMSSSGGADLSPQSDEEEQSSEPSTTLELAQAQHDQDRHHEPEHEPDHGQDTAQPEVSNSPAADVAASSTSGSAASGSDLVSEEEGAAQLNPESMLQAAAHPAQKHQEEAPLYSGS